MLHVCAELQKSALSSHDSRPEATELWQLRGVLAAQLCAMLWVSVLLALMCSAQDGAHCLLPIAELRCLYKYPFRSGFHWHLHLAKMSTAYSASLYLDTHKPPTNGVNLKLAIAATVLRCAIKPCGGVYSSSSYAVICSRARAGTASL